MHRIGALLLPLFLLLAPSHAAMAQELVDGSDEDLIAREEVRSAVETALNTYVAASGPARIDVAIDVIRDLIPYGQKAVPYLANELEQESYATFDFVTYALGFLVGPESDAALREAIDRAEAARGAAALVRKGWACWALGLHGEIEALKLVNEGRHRAAGVTMHDQTTVLEAIALQTAPESVQVLLDQLEAWGETEDKRDDRRFVLRALRRLGAPESAPKLIAILEQEKDDRALRAQAADALRAIETPASIDALVAALSDPAPGVRRSAAFALKWMDRPGDVKALLEHLETEDDLRVREALYPVTAAHVKPEQLPQFLAQWNRPDPEDRKFFVLAIARVEFPEKVSILSAAVEDPSEMVAIRAVGPLARSGGKASVERLEEILASTKRWGVVREIANAARANDLTEMAPMLLKRMLEAVQLDAVHERNLMPAVDHTAEALVHFRYTAALSKLRRARSSVEDREILEVLDPTIDALELVRENGKNVEKWAALLEDPDPNRARLARERLADLGGEQATAALLDAYDDLDILARIETLLLLEKLDSPAVRGLLRRLLLEPESYRVEVEGERKTAAWIVRRFGDQEMLDLLIEAIRVRDGRDVENLIYAAAIGREKVLPLLREYRLPRLRYLGMGRGHEQEVLDWIARRIENGLSIERYDQPPTRMVIR